MGGRLGESDGAAGGASVGLAEGGAVGGGVGGVVGEGVGVSVGEGVGVLVVGWPLTDDGDEGAAVDRVRPFLGRLRKAAPDAEVVLQDERDSSRRAVEDLVAAGVPKQRRREKGILDAAAACVILQDWLDGAR